MITVETLNQLAPHEFIEQLGGIYEHSPWIAQSIVDQRPFANFIALQLAMQQVVEQSSLEEQLTLLKAHPEFAGKAATSGELTEASSREQGSLSLNRLPPEQHARMQGINKRFMDKFGFPGIVAVRKQKSVDGIFSLLEKRLNNNTDTEVQAALQQVHLIAECRLQDLVKAD